MTLVKLKSNPVNTWNSFDKMFETVFNSDNNSFPFKDTLDWKPDVDLNETDKSFIIKADIAGLTKKDIEINIVDDVLTISGNRNNEKDEEGDYFHYRERLKGSFSRSFNLPEIVDKDKITANFKNGILTVELEKKEKMLPRKIEIIGS